MNARTGKPENTVVRNTGGAPLAVLSPDRRRIAVSEQIGATNVVVVYDLKSLRPIGAPLRLHGSAAYPVGYLPDGRLVTTGYTEAGIWTVGKDLPALAIQVDTQQRGPDISTATARFLPGNGAILADFGLDSSVLVHDPPTGHLVGPLLGGAVVGALGIARRTVDRRRLPERHGRDLEPSNQDPDSRRCRAFPRGTRSDGGGAAHISAGPRTSRHS